MLVVLPLLRRGAAAHCVVAPRMLREHARYVASKRRSNLFRKNLLNRRRASMPLLSLRTWGLRPPIALHSVATPVAEVSDSRGPLMEDPATEESRHDNGRLSHY